MYKKLLVVALVMAFVLAGGAALAQQAKPEHPKATPEHPKAAPEHPKPSTPTGASGNISIELNSASALLGASWGQAVLTYGGKTHLYRVRGLKVLAVGLTKLSVGGNVYNLTNLNDMAGTYQKADPAGLTFIVEEKGLVVQNSKGVTINFKGLRKGLGLDLVKEGLTIEPAP